MVLYEDKMPHSSRMIWVNFREDDNTISFDLQDLGEDFESEWGMSGISLDEMLKALHLSDLDSLFAFLLDNYSTVDAMDRINISNKYSMHILAKLRLVSFVNLHI